MTIVFNTLIVIIGEGDVSPFSGITPTSSFVYEVTTQDGVISGVANTLPSIIQYFSYLNYL